MRTGLQRTFLHSSITFLTMMVTMGRTKMAICPFGSVSVKGWFLTYP